MNTSSQDQIATQEQLSFLFQVSMWWRIFYGILRIAVGVTFLRFIGQPLSDSIYALMAHELTGRTGDAVLEKIYLLFETHEFTVTYFIAGYFIFWGTLELILSISLLRHRLHAFPVALFFITLFIFYALFRYTHTHSSVLLTIIVIDIGILYLIYNEYTRLKKKLP